MEKFWLWLANTAGVLALVMILLWMYDLLSR